MPPLLFAGLLRAQPDAVCVNGAVVTMDAGGRVTEGVAIAGGKVLKTGANAEIRKLAAARTRIVDLGGKALLPGFYAAHDHFPSAGL